MTKQQQAVPTHYPCMTQKDGLRRVHEPHDLRIVTRSGRLRRVLARLDLRRA